MRLPLVVAVLVAAAGCIVPDKPPTPTTTPVVTTPPEPTPPSPCELCCEAEEDCRRKVCEREPHRIECRPHHHDYWQGKERAVVLELEAGLVPLPLVPCKRAGCAADAPQGDADNYPLGTAIADFDVPAPALVYEGTGALEVMLNWAAPIFAPSDAPHPAVHVMFDYLTAADPAGSFRTGGELKVGQPFVVPVAPLEADMPHQSKSLWIFRIYTQEPAAFDFNLTVTAVKGRDVATWPAHPDPFKSAPTRLILDAEQVISSKGSAWYWVDGSDAGWQFPERVISWGTDKLAVTVSDVAFTTNAIAPAPTSFVLEYRNASFVSKLGNGDQAGGRAETSSTPPELEYEIEVDPMGYDSPYGASSRWGFRLVPRYDGEGATCPAGTEALLAGCQPFPFELRYRLRIVAHGHPIGDDVA